jgi:hypothetical protein
MSRPTIFLIRNTVEDAMAKKDEQKTKGVGGGNGHGRVKGFVFGFDVEGGSDVLAEGIKALTHAMSKGGVVLTAPATKLALPGKGTAATASPRTVLEGEQFEVEPETVSADATDEQPDFEADENDDADSGAVKPKKLRKPRAPKLLDQPKLNEAKVSLQDFIDAKAPKDMMDKYAVVAVWLKDQFGVAEISMDHIYTAFKYLGIQSELPTDIAKPLNNLLHGRKWIDKGSAAGMFKMNWVGEDAVEKMPSGKNK